MATLTFVPVSEETRTAAAASNSFAAIRNRFATGLFTVTGFDYRHSEKDGVRGENALPVLVCDFGNGVTRDLFVSRLLRSYPVADGKSVKCGGTFVDLVRKHICDPKNDTDAKIFGAILKAVKGKQINCTEREYQRMASFGPVVSTINDFNIVD